MVRFDLTYGKENENRRKEGRKKEGNNKTIISIFSKTISPFFACIVDGMTNLKILRIYKPKKGRKYPSRTNERVRERKFFKWI